MSKEKNVDADGIQVLAEVRDGEVRGMEFGDPVPVAPPAGISKSMSMAERIQLTVRQELSRRAEALGLETFEEADDFDIADDPADPSTPYEENFDPVEEAARQRIANAEMVERIDKRQKELRALRKTPLEVAIDKVPPAPPEPPPEPAPAPAKPATTP